MHSRRPVQWCHKRSCSGLAAAAGGGDLTNRAIGFSTALGCYLLARCDRSNSEPTALSLKSPSWGLLSPTLVLVPDIFSSVAAVMYIIHADWRREISLNANGLHAFEGREWRNISLGNEIELAGVLLWTPLSSTLSIVSSAPRLVSLRDHDVCVTGGTR